MPRHNDPLVSFDVPRDWDNRTIIAFAAPPGEGSSSSANIVITRDRLDDDEELIDYADRHVDELAKRMDGFVLLASKDDEVDGRQAFSVSFSSDGVDGTLAQRLTMVQLADRVVASFTMTAPQQEVAQLAPLFDRIMSSVKFEVAEPS